MFGAPPLIGISNQFKEDLKKIAELRPLVEDYVPTLKEDIMKGRSGTKPIIDPVLLHFRATRRDFGREFILPC